jgi:hypothetical protein
MGFETQEEAESWAENVELRADQLKEERMLAPAYTGPERRRGASREWNNWTDRYEMHHVVWATKEVGELAILRKLCDRALRRSRNQEYSALFTACHLLRESLRERREFIAAECAPWFE